MITIIDYGLGNIRAFHTVFERLKVPVKIAGSAHDMKDATKLILPGVGAFDYAMSKLNASGMREVLDDKVLIEKIPVLGICVGMQMLAKSSEEGVLPGLGWIDAEVKRFDFAASAETLQLPHMGWNTIQPEPTSLLMEGLAPESRFYFLHSYYFVNNQVSECIATTSYGLTFCSAVQRTNIYGVQFHPEKSHSNGMKLLHNFAKL